MRVLRVGVIGAGRLGGFHAAKLARLSGVELVGVVDPIPSRRARLAAQCHTQALADYRALLGQIDAAVLATPTTTHYPIALPLLSRGIHVLVEKPLCATAYEANRLVETARRSGALLQVGHVERFNPALTAARPYIVKPRWIEAVRAGPFSFRSTDVGVVLDLMIHDLDLALDLVGSPVRTIDALGMPVLGPHEDLAYARIEFHNGCVGIFGASRVSVEAQRRMQIWSAEGLASIDFAARKTTLLQPSTTLRRGELDLRRLAAEDSTNPERLLQTHLRREELIPEPVDAIQLELEDFVESIRTGRSPRVTGEAGREAIILAERILGRIRSHPACESPIAEPGLAPPNAA